MLNTAELRLHEHEHGNRESVSTYIRDRFRQSYGATLTHLMPRLFSLLDRQGNIIAAFGLRDAATDRLFMERYLDQPVEDAISEHAGAVVNRSSIIEVGNLATSVGGARAMIVALTCFLHDHGYDWITFTGVATVRAAFQRLGLRPFVLAEAAAERLSTDERLAWGDYFQARPQVMGGFVPCGYQTLLQCEPRYCLSRKTSRSVTIAS